MYIRSAVLALKHDTSTKTVDVKVKVEVRFTKHEVFLMKNALIMKAGCSLWGDDEGEPMIFGYPQTGWLYSFPTQVFGAAPTSLWTTIFEETLGEELLDEDYFGRDEIYAKVYIHNPYTRISVSKRSNVVKGWF